MVKFGVKSWSKGEADRQEDDYGGYREWCFELESSQELPVCDGKLTEVVKKKADA